MFTIYSSKKQRLLYLKQKIIMTSPICPEALSTSMSTFQQYDNFREFLFSFLREMKAKYCYSENEGHVFKVENFSVINKIFVDDP